MFQFIETIKICNSKIHNLYYHQKRVDETFACFFPHKKPFSIEKDIVTTLPVNGVFKFRIEYDEAVLYKEIIPYTPIYHEHFALIRENNINYNFKSKNRSFFNSLKEIFIDSEMIISKEGKITDSSYSNLIFKKENLWYTPQSYLLNGTMRQYLLDEKLIQEADITEENLFNYTHFKLINAMLDITTSYEYDINIIKKATFL